MSELVHQVKYIKPGFVTAPRLGEAVSPGGVWEWLMEAARLVGVIASPAVTQVGGCRITSEDHK